MRVAYRVDRTLDSNGQNCTTIFLTAFSNTVLLLGAAMFVFCYDLISEEDRRFLLLATRGSQGTTETGTAGAETGSRSNA